MHFLHEEGIIESLHEAVKDKLAGANQSRTFYSQVTTYCHRTKLSEAAIRPSEQDLEG